MVTNGTLSLISKAQTPLI